MDLHSIKKAGWTEVKPTFLLSPMRERLRR